MQCRLGVTGSELGDHLGAPLYQTANAGQGSSGYERHAPWHVDTPRLD
jgi:hypothetical protein